MPPKLLPATPLLLLVAFASVHCAWQGGKPDPGMTVTFKTSKKALEKDLIDLRQISPSITVGLRYATSNNVTKRRLYPENMPPLLETDTGHRLARAQHELLQQGYRLKLWDGYRPPRAHVALWRSAPDSTYVVQPTSTSWSRHTQGLAVDVTLVDRDGRELRMPTDFDEFSPAAKSQYIGSDPEIRRNLQILQTAMRNAGFETIESEWWHFWNPHAGIGRVVFASQLGIVLPEHVRRIQIP